MNSLRKLNKYLSFPVLITFMLSTLPFTSANAMMIGTDQVINQEVIQADRERVVEFIDRDDVRKEMQELGVDPDEAKERVMALSDAEVRQLAGELDQIPAGEGAVGAVVGAFVLVFVILLLTDIFCLTDVFDFTRCAIR
ncbi:MAG TPA: PA2779 family protein [Gammaproteobacteria bacterium]